MKGDLFVHLIWNCVLLFAFKNENAHHRRSFHFRRFFIFPIIINFWFTSSPWRYVAAKTSWIMWFNFAKNLSYIRYIFTFDKTRQLVFFFSQKARQDADGRIIPLLQKHDLLRQNTVWKNLVFCPLTTDGKCDCKKPKLWKNTTLFMTLTNNYAHAIMKQKKTCFVITKTSWIIWFICDQKFELHSLHLHFRQDSTTCFFSLAKKQDKMVAWSHSYRIMTYANKTRYGKSSSLVY